jgi:ribosomal protein S18 acetylase RimI-like enzyme
MKRTTCLNDITFTSVDSNNYREYINDIEFLYKEFNQFYLDNNYNNYLSKKENSQMDFIKIIADDFKKDNVLCFVAHKNKELVGYILGYTENLSEYFTTDRISYIDGVYVTNTARGLGIGKQLVQIFSNEMNKKYGTRVVRLNVKSANKDAINLYESIGFSIDDHRMYKVLP